MKRRSVYALLALVALSACTTTTDVLYDHATYQAAVFRPKHLRPLKPVQPDANGEVWVTTLKGSAWDKGPTVIRSPVWVSIVPEVRDKCRAYKGQDLAMRLRQMIGLQPNQQVAYFVTMKVRATDLFRPTPDPRTDTIYPCLDPVAKTDCNVFPKDVDPKHKQWMAETFLTVQIPNGYPWTHLGYTYDWAPGADRYGASEYLVKTGANVEVTEVTAIAEYCR